MRMSQQLNPSCIAEETISAFVAGIMALTGESEEDVRAIAEMTAIVTHKPISVVCDIVFNYLRIKEERKADSGETRFPRS